MINIALASNQLSSKFRKAGIFEEKNFIQFANGLNLIETVLENNFRSLEGELFAVVPKHQVQSPEILRARERLREFDLEVQFLGAPETPSAFSTLLWASDFFGDSALRVLPGDALVSRPSHIDNERFEKISNYMLVANGSEERWGFVKTGNCGEIYEFEARNPISTTIFTGEFMLHSASRLKELVPSILLTGTTESHPHLGEVFMIASESEPRIAVSAETFIPLASPGDVRRFSDSLAE